MKVKMSYLSGLLYASKNVWCALIGRRNDVSKYYWFSVFYYLDVWLNALTYGHPDVTVSGRTGFYNLLYNRKVGCKDLGWIASLIRSKNRVIRMYWKLMMRIIDSTFEPIDGEAHCYQAYENHMKTFRKQYGDRQATKIVFDKGRMMFLGTLLIVSSLACIIIYPVTHWIINPKRSIR